MAMQAALRVDPQIVIGKSSDMKNIRANLSNTMQQLESKISALTSTWEGEDSSAFQSQFGRFRPDIDEMLAIVDEYTKDLDEIAQTYLTTEQKVQQEASALPGDVFGI